jgi:hypothetical protein
MTDDQYPYNRQAEQDAADQADARTPGSDEVNRASCQHMVQNNGTCGNASCSNYGGS